VNWRLWVAGPALCLYATILLILVMTFDLWGSGSRYLYFATEVGLLLAALGLYLQVFRHKHWSDAAEPEDSKPRPRWRSHAAFLLGLYLLLVGIMATIWVLFEHVDHEPLHVWLRSAMWYGYYVVIYGIFVVLVRKRMQFVNFRALLISVLFLEVLLTGYEAILLAMNTGWRYNHTVIGWLFNVPVDNILFIYPVAPALCMVLYSVVTARLNDLKAFWALVAFLFVASSIVELIGIYPLDLWEIFNEGSIWPMGQTNLEEFLYYLIFELLSLLLYLFFDQNLKAQPAKVRAG